MNDLQQSLQNCAAELGGDYFGVANLRPARDFLVAQGGGFLEAYPYAISVGIRLPEGIVKQLPRHKEPMVAQTYDYTAYNILNPALDRIALALCQILQTAGYNALAVPSSQTIDRANLKGLFSHKLAAHLAGLGWIGKSCLLITPDHGPRLRLVTVLTDAPLLPGTPMPEQCGTCRLCVEACPPQAFTGQPFRDDEPREARFNPHACEAYRQERAKVSGARACGLCVYVCPYGRAQQE